MTNDERRVGVERSEPETGRRSRLRSALETTGTVAGVVVVILIVNLGSIPAGLTVGQLVIGFIALSVAVEAVRWVRRGARDEARRRLTREIAEYGGGIYGTAALATFIWLNVTDVLEDIAAAGSFGAWVGQMSVGWLIGEAVEAVIFGVQAMIWPWYWFSAHGFVVVAAIGGAVLVVDALREPVARWVAEARRDT